MRNSIAGLLRTMELILGLKPMSQYDAAATPMWRCFARTADTSPYITKAAKVDINEKNGAVNSNSRRSSQFNLSHPDAVDDLVFSEIVWQTVRGPGSVMPAPRRGAFVRLGKAADGDEDDDDD